MEDAGEHELKGLAGARRVCRLVEFDTDETRSRSRLAFGHERVRTTQRDPPRGPSQKKHAEQNIAYEIWPGDFDSCAAAAAQATGGIGAADRGCSRRQHQAPSRLASSYQGTRYHLNTTARDQCLACCLPMVWVRINIGATPTPSPPPRIRHR